MSLIQHIKNITAASIQEVYGLDLSPEAITVNQTKPEFEGNYTIVLFSLIKQLKRSPEQAGQELGTAIIKSHSDLFTGFNVIKGFLNLEIGDRYFLEFLKKSFNDPKIGQQPPTGKKVMVEYSSPNTNKPIHLGHLRNNFLGWSIAAILEANGGEVMKTCIVNDRGIHICKSMIAWKLYGNGATPESTGMKGDHFVGKYYVQCENRIREEAAGILEKVQEGNFEAINEKDKQKLVELLELRGAIVGDSDKEIEKRKKIEDDVKEIVRSNTPIMKQAQEMLVAWEQEDPEVRALWKMMNGWVYDGFEVTYKTIGSDFDKTYYESETYLPGKRFVDAGVQEDVFFKKEDGSTWIDLTDQGLDEKLVLRKDGTSVYITQDLGLAQQKFEEFPYDQSIYVIADEQNYHMKVLQLILKKTNKPYADGIFHLSYGMVELPGGRMKSREGNVVDADEMVDEMNAIAARHTSESGKVKDFEAEELNQLYQTIGLGALKFFLLRVDPKKRMIFNPEESIDFHGFTGPFIQYTHARIKSILRRESPAENQFEATPLLKLEKELLLMLEQYPVVLKQAADEYNPSVIAIYCFNVAKTYNSFYTEHSVLNAESEEKKQLRLMICQLTANVIKHSMGLLGIRVPEKM
ncbi:MAG: arginine--tRNA ligase [Flavisolibacter sp.]|jgi:arginyl-tRNA synthetase|nr:arginine--tRNA ligase [Flavisolibacter sp.]